MNLPPYKIFPTVTTGTVVLREILPTNTPDIIDISFYDAKPATTLEAASMMLDKINQDYHAGTAIHWGIIDKSTNKLVGTCGYYRGFDQQTGEIGCILKSAFQGQGYMTAALQAVIDFGFKTIGLTRIFAVTTAQNTKATRLLEQLNFTRTTSLSTGKITYELN